MQAKSNVILTTPPPTIPPPADYFMTTPPPTIPPPADHFMMTTPVPVPSSVRMPEDWNKLIEGMTFHNGRGFDVRGRLICTNEFKMRANAWNLARKVKVFCMSSVAGHQAILNTMPRNYSRQARRSMEESRAKAVKEEYVAQIAFKVAGEAVRALIIPREDVEDLNMTD